MRSGPMSNSRSSEGLPISTPAAPPPSALPKPLPFLAAFARVSPQPFLDSATRDRKRSATKAFEATTSARERGAHRQPVGGLDTAARSLREPAGTPHSSRTV